MAKKKEATPVEEQVTEVVEEKKEKSLKDLLRELIQEELQNDTDPAKVESNVLKKVEKTEEQKKQEEWLNELVPFKAFKDNDKYKDDIIVGHNGTTYQIKRGHEVMIPRKVLLIIQRSENQRRVAAEYMEEQQESFRRDVAEGKL